MTSLRKSLSYSKIFFQSFFFFLHFREWHISIFSEARNFCTILGPSLLSTTHTKDSLTVSVTKEKTKLVPSANDTVVDGNNGIIRFFMYTLHDRLRENKTSKRRHKIITKEGPAVVDKCRRLQHNKRRVIVVAATIQLTL